MRFDCGPTAHERRLRRHQRLSHWHTWFAWFPVRLQDNQCAWLERIERKGTLNPSWDEAWWSYEYRAPQRAGGR
jgi:hypothetical protein